MKVEDSKTSILHLLTSFIHNAGRGTIALTRSAEKLATTAHYALRIFSRPSFTFLVAFRVSTTSRACLTIVS